MVTEELRYLLSNVQKPARYIGGERLSTVKDFNITDVNFVFCFPDTYEIGMSHLGLKVIYEILNKEDWIWCQRAFMPLPDMQTMLKQSKLLLFSLEGKQPLSEFDVVGFTLQYELCYTNVLAMMSLSGIPLVSSERGDNFPLIIAGGPCTCNPEPMADFIDLFVIGEGEHISFQICNAVREAKQKGYSKRQLLLNLSLLDGIYIPEFYTPVYNADGEFERLLPTEGVPSVVKKALASDFCDIMPPTEFTVPMIGAVHDRAQIEILRGCVRGCRFCQAGYIYRPFRQRSADDLCKAAKQLCDNTGYDEISLTSLSSSDHTQIEQLLTQLLGWTQQAKINLSLPSLRVDNFNTELAQKLSRVRKSGLTFAPEGGTQRLRDAINKNITQDELQKAVTAAFDNGYTSVKLYFMIGLPTETDEDVLGIATLSSLVVDWFYQNPKRQKGKGVTVSVSVSCFIPKPCTPFERVSQNSEEEFRRKQKLLISAIKTKKISLSYHDSDVSVLEAALARGDRRQGSVILSAFNLGCNLDGWSEYFSFAKWQTAFADCNLSMEHYAKRERDSDEALPWQHLDYGIDSDFLKLEYQKATRSQLTSPCNEVCSACGISKDVKGVSCVCNKGTV